MTTADRDWDDSFGRAARAAAESVVRQDTDKSFLEKRLAAALGKALEAELPSGFRISLSKKLAGFVLPGWDPQPGFLDLAVLEDANGLVVAAEIKLDDIDQTLWDIFKVAAALEIETVEAAYVIAAAPKWNLDLEVVELFEGEGEEEWATRYFFEAYRKSWERLLRGGRGRPTTIAETLSVTPITRCPVVNFSPYELRAIRIRAFGNPLPLHDGWPEPPLD